MRYKTKSADVLNEADRFENMLNWQLFCAEQDRLLWGPSPYDSWMPGTPIHKHPRVRFDEEVVSIIEGDEDMTPEQIQWLLNEDGPVGNCARRMIEEFDDGEKYWSMRCEPCGVSWGRPDGDYCWMCGASYPWPELKQMKFSHIPFPRRESMGNVMDIETTEEGLVAYIRLNLENEMGARWAEILRQQMSAYSIGMRQAAQAMNSAATHMRGLHSHFTVIDEWRGNDRFRYAERDIQFTQHVYNVWGAEPYRPPVLPPTHLFERAEREVVLVESRIAEVLPWIPRGPNVWVYGVDIPADVDLSGRREPALPRMPEPRQFPDYRDTYWDQFQTPITQERRRR